MMATASKPTFPRSVAIIGAGTMGTGIAQTCLLQNISVVLIDASPDATSRARRRLTDALTRLYEKGRITASPLSYLTHLTISSDLSQAAGADLVIEAVFEDLRVKQDLFAKLLPHLEPTTIVATNTSALRVEDLTSSVLLPERFIGLHYFSPAEVNPLVEVVVGKKTSAETQAAAEAFLIQTGKQFIRCRDAQGFVVNRFFCPYCNEAVRLADEGIATLSEIDNIACTVLGVPLGPFAVMNIVKPRIMLNAVQNLSPLGPNYSVAKGLALKGGQDEKWLLEQAAPPLPPVSCVVADRLLGAMFLPVLEAIEENVAAPEAFDIGAELALRLEPGPVARMQSFGRDETLRLVRLVARAEGTYLAIAGLDLICPA